MFEIIVAFQELKELFNFIIFFSFLYQISHRDFAGFWEELSHKLLDFFVDDLIGNAEHFEAGTDATVNQELQFDELKPLHFVEIENIKKDFVI